MALTLKTFDLFADEAGLRLAVPEALDAHWLSRISLRPERLAEPPLIARDEPGSSTQYRRGGTIVAFQPNNLCVGEVLLEAQDVFALRAAPAVDRLVVIAHAADIVLRHGEQAQPEILGDVGILIFIHEQITEALLPALRHLWPHSEERQIVQQQVTEVAGIQGEQPLLVSAIEVQAASYGEVSDLRSRNKVRRGRL